MKIDAPLRGLPLAEVRQRATELEQLGFDGVWGDECQHDPFLPMLEIALGTEKLQFGTNIAIAFARAPFSMAMTAWDLQKVSGGRFLLGLGTQVRAHIERRFSTSFDHPAARVTDYIHCLQAIWDSFQNGTKPNYHGRFYQFTLNNDLFNPGPIDHPDIEVYLAGVNPRMARGRRSRRWILRTSVALTGVLTRYRQTSDRRRRTTTRQDSDGCIATRGNFHHSGRDRNRAPQRRARRSPTSCLLRLDTKLSNFSRLPRPWRHWKTIERGNAQPRLRHNAKIDPRQLTR